jgi:para-aminobenzoate synthetase component 1
MTCRPHFRKARVAVSLPAVSEVFAGLNGVSIVGGNPAKKDAGRFSYWAARPIDVFEFKSGDRNPFGGLQRALDKYRLANTVSENAIGQSNNSEIFRCTRNDKADTENPPAGILPGGWIGYFSYELGRLIEPTVFTGAAKLTEDLKMPLIRLCFYDRLICYDHLTNDFWLIVLELWRDTEHPEGKFANLEELLAQARQVPVKRPKPADLDNIDFSAVRCNMDRPYYLRAVERTKRYIYDGDVYQINFSQRFECDFAADPIELFHWQNHYNPSGYAAYLDAGDFQIVSASPEMFVTVADGVISTKPIKGTRRRLDENGPDSTEAGRVNARNFEELLRSEKEQAELNMIIDLERNDVARICKSGTRSVIQPRTIESYPTVFHAVATVAGELRNDVSFCDILGGMFPGGSITGAPKIRSMEIIEQTEPTARGVYTGGIGYIGLDGSVSLNIAIRTVIVKDGKAFVQTGGGIVADSEPDAEWDETITKARALLAGIKAVQTKP